ncbi:MAG: hypothetical protein PHI60_00965 [Candidatus Omnitrophica bacterium]|nr:hypothetical protein [Candidatus Omnitrophota bacterium]
MTRKLKKAVLFFMPTIFLISILGCETTKAVKMDLDSVGRSLSSGVDAVWQALEEADYWVQRNLW